MVIVLIVSLAQQAVTPAINNAIAPPAVVAPGQQGPADAANDPADPANPPYPTQQDLRAAGAFPLPGEAEQEDQRPGPSPRREFLKMALRPAVWSNADPIPPDRVLVSPDANHMAYVSGTCLVAGLLGTPEVVSENGPANGGGMLMGAGRMRGGWGGPAAPPPPVPRGDGPRSRLCGWAADGRVFWSNPAGHVLSYNPRAGNVQQTTLRAELAMPLGAHYLALRDTPRPKGNLADPAHDSDVTELTVLDDMGQKHDSPGLMAVQGAEAQFFAVSPDAKRVAIVAADAPRVPPRSRLIVLNPEQAGDVITSPDAARYAGVCWTSDGKALVYARSQVPAPPDHGPGMPEDACDLFLFDLDAKKETRLSRGGGYSWPSVTKDADGKEGLYFVNRTAAGVNLEEMPLQNVRSFAVEQEKAEAERAAAWTELAGAIYKEADVPFAEDRLQLSPASMSKLADAFAKVYTAKFKDDPPTAPPALDQLRREITGLGLAAPVQARLRVVLGAVAGERVVRQQKGSAWHLGQHSLAPNAAVSVETPFGLAVNPFQAPSLAEVLYRAEGRPVVLSDDAAAARQALDKLTDPELARATDLLKQGKGAEADRILIDVAKRHPGNHALIVHVGTLLQEHGRTKALVELCRPLLEQIDAQGGTLPRDPRLYNLVGIAALESGSDKAVLAFHVALRCDLEFGPAYINLSQAYMKAGSAEQVRLCLRRYLKLFPKGAWADEARRRLATEGDKW
jgi:hypothetical protein